MYENSKMYPVYYRNWNNFTKIYEVFRNIKGNVINTVMSVCSRNLVPVIIHIQTANGHMLWPSGTDPVNTL